MGNLSFKVRVQVRKEQQFPDKRIAAKCRLWDFINDIKPQLLNWQDSEAEMANQLITSALQIMQPVFNALEIDKEVREIYRTMCKELPQRYTGIFADALTCYIRARLK